MENILVTRMGIVKLIEFGDVLENYLKNPEDENSTHYLAPEVWFFLSFLNNLLTLNDS